MEELDDLEIIENLRDLLERVIGGPIGVEIDEYLEEIEERLVRYGLRPED